MVAIMKTKIESWATKTITIGRNFAIANRFGLLKYSYNWKTDSRRIELIEWG
jgi:hypothetical protein